MRRGLIVEELLHDVRISLRGLLRAPVMTLAIVATVGLGIGATTVIFGAIDAALLRPLPYAHPTRLVQIYTDSSPNKFPFSVADYLATISTLVGVSVPGFLLATLFVLVFAVWLRWLPTTVPGVLCPGIGVG